MVTNISSTSRWIDISIPFRNGMPSWPGEPSFQIKQVSAIERGDLANVSLVSMSVHTGTHMDPPLHFIPGRESIDNMPLEATVGPARVIQIEDTISIKPEELQKYRIRRGERILFKTRNSTRCWKTDKFIEDYVFISKEAAQFLAKRGVRAVGIDYLSVGGFKNEMVEPHETLLGAGIWVIEGLNLSQVPPGRYELICLPLKIEGGNGSPARAIIKPIRQQVSKKR